MKRSIRFLSLFLSALLLLQALGLSAFALDLEISYSNVDFDDLNAGDALKTSTQIARVPTYAQVCERADGDLYAAVPFKGKVSDRSTYEGNPDTSIYAKNTATTWEDGALILSIDYYLHYVDLAAEDCG